MKNKIHALIKSILIIGIPSALLSSCITNDVSSSANTSKEVNTISFYDDTILIDQLNTAGHEIITLPDTPLKDNYEFNGWYFDKNIWNNKLTEDYYQNISLTSDVSVYAYYVENVDPVPNEYTISFYVDDEIYTTIETSGNETITLPEAPLKDNYEFNGWYFDKNIWNNKLSADYYQNISLTSDVSVYAHYEIINDVPKEFKVSFVTYGGTKVNDLLTSRLETEPYTEKEGYTFLGWYLEKTFINKITFPYEVTKDITLYAKWEENVTPSLNFIVDENGVLTKVEGISENNSDIEIPSHVNNIEIKEIGDKVFLNNIYLTRLVVPETVKIIGYKMCYGCINLTEVVLSNNITVIPDYAFENCTSLEKINFPSSLLQIRSDAFKGTSLKEFNAPNSLKEIWDYAFKDAKQLTTVNLNNVTKLGTMSFENCEKLETINLPNTLKEVGQYVFNGCKKLVNINMPDKAISIKRDMFTGTGFYEDINNWDNGVLYVDNYLVSINSDFIKTTQYTVKEGTISIASNAFLNNARNLKTINLPEGLIIIGEEAFNNLSSLIQINIPSTVKSIGYNAFAGTKIYDNQSYWVDNGFYIDNWLINVKKVSLNEFSVKEGTIGISDGKDTGLFPTKAQTITKLTLPSSLKFIGERSFRRLRISELILPSGLESIGKQAFMSCASLSSVNLGDCTNLAYIGDQAFSEAMISDITIPESVVNMGELIFNNNSVDLTVHCMVNEKPSGWNANWNFTNKENVKIIVEWNN